MLVLPMRSPRDQAGSEASWCIIRHVTDPATHSPVARIGTAAALFAAFAGNVAVAWVAWIVAPEPNGGTPHHSDFGVWLWIVVASGASWTMVGIMLIVQRQSPRLGLAVLVGVAGAYLLVGVGLLMVAIAAGS